MIFLSNCFLILVGLTGKRNRVCYCSITTVKETSVKPGESISIPCLYESKYEKHVKYLCKGFYWATCSYVVKTNKPDTSGKFSVQDDKEQKTVTLTINHVESTDSDYWCVVEIDGGADVGEYFRLSVSGEYLFSPVFFCLFFNCKSLMCQFWINELCFMQYKF
uniref:Immunoglobulin domain-containing protein n=1 Tax=Oryzias sinensis TaxID=183150 RepID=A0A8C7YQQ9_9TELE